MSEPTPPAEKLARSKLLVSIGEQLNLVSKTLQDLKDSPPKTHFCSKENDIASLKAATKSKLTPALMTTIIIAMLGLSVTGLQVCSEHSNALAANRVEIQNNKEDIEDIADVIRENSETTKQILEELRRR